ncbi:UDP-N-acetylmuramoyl-tripeptide--D-alanyl-D-alanine ligase [uncultured Tyzzerella sp.]|uniref:UDP-N-acetylmuramoyl-tripeptide--D-alanyl-D- alanine ligase n=1 Tax=uncultured Tyzzerella sp. TaxID=2321398 RepID=UPI0029426365|nr:UDP-N-acetylmuramoyl-tripeptide--D-alanyl-D-alanine ligase [uncultured Tyzzerella sp.]
MKPIFIEDVIKAVNGCINNNINTDDIFIKNISTDTRTIKQGDLFIPIVGENFDGHNFIDVAFEKGAIACLSQKDIKTDNIVIKVGDTKDALKDLAIYYKSLFNIPVIALTGSAGKTTTKDMLASCLSVKYNTVKTQGNFNNEIGLPLTIFNIEEDTQVVVLEMGMNHFGEIRELSKIAKPDIALITNIGVSHIENLGSREGILRAKYEIFEYLKPNGIKILNGDDDMLYTLKEDSSRCYFYSVDSTLDAYATNIKEKGIEGISATINYFDKSFNLDLKIPGKHMISNALAVTLVCSILGLKENEIKEGLETFKPSKMRMDIIKVDKYTVINDAYNANPTSMKATLDVLATTKGRKVAILGDMFELGEYSNDMHYDVGKYATEKGIDELIFIGEHSYYMLQGANSNKNSKSNINYFKTQDDFIKDIYNVLNEGDTILVKASRGMKLENTVDKIIRRESNAV